MSDATLRTESKKVVRRPVAEVRVTWTDPLIDTSLDATATESNRGSHISQVADLVIDVPRKWFHTNDTDVTLTGTFYPMPGSVKESRKSQVGWWGTQSADGSGNFTTDPSLSVTFTRRPVRSFKVSGDSALNEYPVDFTFRVYTTVGGVFSLVDIVAVTGNTLLNYEATLVTEVQNATKIELVIEKWSTPGKVVKIAEFYTDIVEVFDASEIFFLNIMQEFEGSEGTLPIGNISCNEMDLSLQNITDRFFSGNTSSDLYNLVKRNRKIEPFVGFQYTNGSQELVPFGLYWSGDWTVPDLGTDAQTTARDRMELFRKKDFPHDTVFPSVLTNVTVLSLLETVFDSLIDYMYDLFWDLSDIDDSYVVDYFDPEFFSNMSYFEVVKILASSMLAYAYMDTPTAAEIAAESDLMKDIVRVKRSTTVIPSVTDPADSIDIEKRDFIDKAQPAETESMANTIIVTYKVFDELGESVESTYTAIDDDSVINYGTMIYEYEANDLIQTEAAAMEVADILLESFKVPLRDVEIQSFGDVTLELADQVSVPEYQKGAIDQRGIFSLTRISTTFDGSLRATIEGRKVTDDNRVTYAGRAVMAQPDTVDAQGVLSFPATDAVSGYNVEPFTLDREADTYVVPDATTQAPIWTVQPVDDTVVSGGTAGFTGTVTGIPTPSLQWWRSAVTSYFLAGTADKFVEAEWTQLIAADSISWDGATATIAKASGSGVWDSNYSGTTTDAEVRVTVASPAANQVTHLMNVISGSDRVHVYYQENNDTLTVNVQKGGVNDIKTTVFAGVSLTSATVTMAATGSDVTVVVSINGGTSTASETYIGGFNDASSYYLRMQGQDGAQTYTYMRIDGQGFPNVESLPYTELVGETTNTLTRTDIGTTGDNFGDKYKNIATNTAGVATTNVVTTIEA